VYGFVASETAIYRFSTLHPQTQCPDTVLYAKGQCNDDFEGSRRSKLPVLLKQGEEVTGKYVLDIEMLSPNVITFEN
jgi:hypothetical protein